MNMNIDPNLVLAVRDWRNTSGLTDAQMAVLAATDETLEQGMISDATWAKCCEHLAAQEERIEMVLAISNWRTFSELLQSLKRSEEHTSELQSLMRISYAVFCLKK